MGRSKEECYCAFCRSKRRVYAKKGITLVNILAAVVTSTILMLATWQTMDLRVIPIFAIVLGLAEIFIQIRWRLGVVCPHCGFDPVLYIRSHQKAETKVKNHLEQRKKTPAILLSRHVILNLPRRKVSNEAMSQK